MGPPPNPRALLNLAQVKIVVLDAEGEFRYANAAVRDVLGFEPEDLVGENALDLIHPEDASRIGELFGSVVEGERDPPSGFEYRYATADDDWVWLRSDLYPPRSTGIDGYVLSSRDVTEERESKRRLETIAEQSSDVLWMFTADWDELLFVNDAVEEVFGLSAEMLERRPQAFLEHVHPEDRPYVKRAMARLSAGESTNLDYRVDPETDFSRWVRVPASPIFEGDEVVRVAGFVRDVSEEYKRKRQLTVMDNLLRHTIRNDMNVITGTASRIADRVEETSTTEDNVEEALAAVAEHAETIRRIGEQLLATAEKQRDVIELLNTGGSVRPIDLDDVIDEAVAATREAAEEAVLTVDRAPEATVFTVPAIEYALGELLGNAVEHAEGRPEVRLGVEETGESVVITVRDNCPPIPAEEQLVVTDRREMTDVYHTVGMGLWLVYWVVERSGGDLSFDVADAGNVVTLSLPNAEGFEMDDSR